MSDKSKLEALTRMFMEELGVDRREKPRLRIVKLATRQANTPQGMDSIVREAHYRRIRYLARAYRLRWLLDQETFHVTRLECLDDEQLSRLLADMERARECMQDDVSFEEAGLIRSRA